VTLKDDMLTDLDDVFFDTDEFAEEVSYTRTDWDAVDITIIREEQNPSNTDASPGDEMIIRTKASDMTDPPQRGDTFKIDDETWYFKANLGINAGEIRLRLTRSGWKQQ